MMFVADPTLKQDLDATLQKFFNDLQDSDVKPEDSMQDMMSAVHKRLHALLPEVPLPQPLSHVTTLRRCTGKVKPELLTNDASIIA